MYQQRYIEPYEQIYHEVCAGHLGDPDTIARAGLSVDTLTLTAKQAELAGDITTPIIMANGGRRGGKSAGSGAKVPIMFCVHPRGMGAMISPTSKKSKIMWKWVNRFLPSHWVSHSVRFPQMQISTHTGASMQFQSAYDPDSGIGEGLHWIGFDEFQSITEKAFGLAVPAVSDGGDAFQIWGCGTPRMGVYRARYERLKRMERESNGLHAKVMRFTAKDNCFIKTGAGTIFALAEGMLDARTRAQELDALFVAEEGLVYFEFAPERHVLDFASSVAAWDETGGKKPYRDITRAFLRENLTKNVPYDWVIGVDYGMGRQFAIIYKIVSCPNGRAGLFAVDEVIFDRDTSVEKLGREMLRRGYWPGAVCDDASGPKSKGGEPAEVGLEHLRVERGKKLLQPFTCWHYSRNKPVVTRVGTMNSLMEHDRYAVDPRCERLIFALENQELADGKPMRSKPGEVSLHDPNDAAGYPAVYLLPATVQYGRHEQERAMARKAA